MRGAVVVLSMVALSVVARAQPSDGNEPSSGAVVVRPSDAQARLFVDGIDRGGLVDSLRIEGLPTGLHRLRVAVPGLGEREEAFFVERGQATELALAPLASGGGEGLLPAELRFSEAQLRYYRVPSHQVYAPSETSALLERFRGVAGPVCEAMRGVGTATRAQRLALMREEAVRRPPWPAAIHRIVAGCFNYFMMNDLHPERDFEFVRAHYPGARKECFSVGLMQPYWMHTILGCERLTVVDFDWRIHDAHLQLLQAFREGRLGDEATFARELGRVKLGWAAQFMSGPVMREAAASPSKLCGGGQAGRCARVLRAFQSAASGVRSVSLQVSALHDADYTFLPNATPVIYFSNALESAYTSRAQFDVLMGKIARGLAPEARAVLIYHVAGRAQFGVYELVPKPDGYALTTVCRDRYLTTFTLPGKGAVPYKTWLERVTSTVEPPVCSSPEPRRKRRR